MGSFANALFSVLLGWIQGTVSWLWNLIASADAGAWMNWVMNNWLPLLVLLCVAGLAVDLLVYLVRWQPYRVWRSFLSRMDDGDAEDDAEMDDHAEADRRGLGLSMFRSRRTDREAGHTAAPVQGRSDVQEAEDRLDAPIRPVKRVLPTRQRRSDRSADTEDGWEDAYHAPYYPPQWNSGDKPSAAEAGENRARYADHGAGNGGNNG